MQAKVRSPEQCYKRYEGLIAALHLSRTNGCGSAAAQPSSVPQAQHPTSASLQQAGPLLQGVLIYCRYHRCGEEDIDTRPLLRPEDCCIQ